jgi:hypothetical protein
MAARILGRNVQLFVNSSKLALPISLGEIDEFSSTSTTDMIKSRPIGYILEAASLRFGGYDLSFKIGKTNPMLERWGNLVDRGLITGTQPPELFIIEKVNYYKKTFECWVYRNVTLYSPEINISSDEYGQSIKGFAAYKEIAPADISFFDIEFGPQIAFQEVVFRTKDVAGSVVDDIINSKILQPRDSGV